MVWPMMIVTVANFEGFTGQQFEKLCKNVEFGHFCSFLSEICLVKLLKFVTVTVWESVFNGQLDFISYFLSLLTQTLKFVVG